MQNCTITFGDTGYIEIYLPYNEEMKAQVQKDFLGAFYNWSKKCWCAPYLSENVNAVIAWEARYHAPVQFSRGEDIHSWEDQVLLPLVNQSFALAPRKPLPPIHGLKGKLYPFQEAAVEFALERRQCLIADDNGAGKSIEALAALVLARAYPAVIVCPAHLILPWAREIKTWFPSLSFHVLEAETQERKPLYLVSYSRLEKHFEFLKGLNLRCGIFDESQWLKDYQATQTRMAQQLAKDMKYRFLLSATPMSHGHADLISQLRVLGRHDVLINTQYFAETYCGADYSSGNKTPSGNTNPDKLIDQLRFYCMIGRSRGAFLSLPEVSKPIPVFLGDEKKHEHLSAEKSARCTALLNPTSWLLPSGSTPEAIERLRRQSFETKKAAVSEWIRNSITTMEKLVVFGYHVDYLEELAHAFSALYITGNFPSEKADAIVQRFQTEPGQKLIFLTFGVGSHGWRLDAADKIAFIEVDWNYSTHRQAEGRLISLQRKKPIQVFYLLAANTYEEYMMNTIAEKHKTTSKIPGDYLRLQPNQALA
jgi:SWI/SNF-related matrix-associated actin-dependent regulator 1 of chromatin subfamily A